MNSEEIKTVIRSRISPITRDTYVTIEVSCGDMCLCAQLTGCFLGWKVKRKVKEFREAIKALRENE